MGVVVNEYVLGSPIAKIYFFSIIKYNTFIASS